MKVGKTEIAGLSVRLWNRALLCFAEPTLPAECKVPTIHRHLYLSPLLLSALILNTSHST